MRSRPTLLLVPLVALSCMPEARDSITDPASPQAAQIDGLWTFALWTGVAVWVAVMILLAVPVLRSRRRNRDDDASDTDTGNTDADNTDADNTDAGNTGASGGSSDTNAGNTDADNTGASGSSDTNAQPNGDAARVAPARAPGAVLDEPLTTADPAAHDEAQRDHRVRSRLLWIGGIIGPAIILVVLLIYNGQVASSVAHTEQDGELVIDVHGHMFWWEVHYPEQDITTANEIHVPVDQPVRLRLTTEDVIHSFWIPRVHGKIDMIPGTENWLSFEATETGRFRGQCAEFCGIAHAQMVKFLEVQEPDEFDAWVENQQQPAVEPDTAQSVQGQQVFFEYGCAACHTVTGTDAIGGVGPDLTHLASRGSLASGIVPNTRENLADLIVEPWTVKPGNPMPPTALDDDDLDALLDYLEVLE